MLEGRNLWELVTKRAAATPDATMTIDDADRSITYGEFRDAAERAAAGLANQHGIGAGDVVSWMLPTWHESLILAVALGAFFGFMYMYRRSTKLQYTMDRLLLKVPVVGNVLHNSSIARFARTLAVTFKAGVPLVEALDIVSGATGNQVYEKAVHEIRDDVAVGYQLNVAMKQVNLFPHMVTQMAAIGEEAGALDTMLFKVAEFYEEEVNNAVDALSSLLEPMIMIFIGGVVGCMVIGMYLPNFKLAAAI